MTRFTSQRAPSVHAIGAAQLVAWGATFYAIPPLLPRISADLAVSLPTLSIAMTVGLLVNAVAALAVAAWIQRRGARVPMVVGSVVATLALLATASSSSGQTACTSLALLGAAHAALLYEPAFAAVSARTRDPIARTRDIQIITFWGGWAALWALPAASLLAELVGWRITVVLLAALLAAHTIRIHARLPAQPSYRPVSVRRASAICLRLAAAFALAAFATTAIVVNGLLLLSDRNVSIAGASTVFALLAPLQILGRFWFMRRQGRLARHDAPLPFLLVAAGVIALLAAPRWFALASFVITFGAGAGLLTTIRAAIVVTRATPEDAVSQLGTYSFVTGIARALAPALSSGLYGWLGYQLALIAFAAMALVAAALVWSVTSWRAQIAS